MVFAPTTLPLAYKNCPLEKPLTWVLVLIKFGPAGPVAPVAPCAPCGPVAPVSPLSPLSPFGPCVPLGKVRFKVAVLPLLVMLADAVLPLLTVPMFRVCKAAFQRVLSAAVMCFTVSEI